MYPSRSNIKILSLHLQETGTYNPMFERPMVTAVSHEALDDLITRVDQMHTKKVQPNVVAGMAYGMVAPSATPQGQISIPNGWDTRRIRFILHVMVEHNVVGLTNEEFYFQGFTDYAGVTPSGIVDPNMLLVINNFIKITQVINYNSSAGLQYERRVAEAGQVINGDIIYHGTGINNYGLRPDDMFIGIQSAHLFNSQTDQALMFDSRFQLNNKALKANKYHVTPAHYLASVTDSFCMAKLSANIQNNGQDVFETAKGIINTDMLHMNTFFKAMKGIRGLGNGTVFSMGDLAHLDPNVGHVTNCLTIGPTNRTQFHSIGETEYWDGATLETQHATILGNAVPALLMELMLSKVTFMASNYVSGGEGVITLIDGVTITGVEMTQYFEVFKQRLLTEVLNDITYSNQFKYNIMMQVDIFGETIIDIALNGGPTIRYTVPTFCDGIASPMMTHSRDHFFNSVNDIETVLVNVHEAIGGEYGTINPYHAI